VLVSELELYCFQQDMRRNINFVVFTILWHEFLEKELIIISDSVRRKKVLEMGNLSLFSFYWK